jgi:pimeloyl-ACP methyl ester carboxylesterase
MPVVERNGLSFHTQELGAGGKLVIMLHGLLVGSMTTWYFGAAPRLARANRVRLYDLRGHGRSARAPSGYDRATMAADLFALHHEDEPAVIVGHSYGAVVALEYARRHPARVAGLALVEAPIPPGRLAEIGDFAARGADEMLRSLPPALAGAVERGGRAAAKLLDQLRFLAEESSLLRDLAAQETYDLDGLASLRVPTLCIYGESSSCRPAGERLAKAIPGAQLVILKGGHFLPVEAPAAVTDELVTWLS